MDFFSYQSEIVYNIPELLQQQSIARAAAIRMMIIYRSNYKSVTFGIKSVENMLLFRRCKYISNIDPGAI